MRAHHCHQATVVTIGGDVDAASGDSVHDFVTRFVLAGNALVLDLSGIRFFAAAVHSVLISVDDACSTAEVPWAVVGNRVVNRVLQLTNCDAPLPTARSVPEALQRLSLVIMAEPRNVL